MQRAGPYGEMHDEMSKWARYHRQMLLPEWGAGGQQRLQQSTVALLGCGALGAMSANLLARAGVGHLIVADRDFVELTNLQRQVLFDESDVRNATPKAEAAKARLRQINSDITVTARVDDINHDNIATIVADADLLVDGLDNFETRYLANDLAVKRGIPYVYGGAVGTSGMAYVVLPHTEQGDAPWEMPEGHATPCLRCLFEEAPPPGAGATCDTAGVLGPLISLIASFQVTEALKILSGNFKRCATTLLNVDLWSNDIMQLDVSNAREDGDCPCCKQRRYEYLEGKLGSEAAVLCGRDAVQLRTKRGAEAIDFDVLAARLRPHGSVSVNEYLLRATLNEDGEPRELTVFADGRAIVKGTDEPSAARALFAKYVGH